MKGSIDKYTTKGSSKPHWRYRIYLGKNEHGKKLWGARAGFEKQAEALDAMRKRIDELRASTDLATAPPTQNKTLGGWLEVWFDTYALDCCEPKTIERYRELADYLLKESDGIALRAGENTSPRPQAHSPRARVLCAPESEGKAPRAHFSKKCKTCGCRGTRRTQQSFQARTDNRQIRCSASSCQRSPRRTCAV
jgi:hypothetical protein